MSIKHRIRTSLTPVLVEFQRKHEVILNQLKEMEIVTELQIKVVQSKPKIVIFPHQIWLIRVHFVSRLTLAIKIKTLIYIIIFEVNLNYKSVTCKKKLEDKFLKMADSCYFSLFLVTLEKTRERILAHCATIWVTQLPDPTSYSQ